MNLTLIISDDCESCDRAKRVIEKLRINYPQITTETLHINSFSDRKISITPALLVNNKLFSYGDIDEIRLLSKIN